MRRIISLTILSLVILISGCQSCSKSGRAKKREEILKDRYNSGRNKEPVHRDPERKDVSPDPNFNKPAVTEDGFSSRASTLSELFPTLEKAVFIVYSGNKIDGSQGSGFFISSSGIGITNNHVIDGHLKHGILTADGMIHDIDVILDKSEQTDYAIFKVDGGPFPFLQIASKRPKIGDDVFAIGSPRGLENSLTKGSISQERISEGVHFWQIDATIDHGSSGGALFNMEGEVIGITSSGFEGSNLNFAVDIQDVPYNQYLNR